MPTLRSFWTNSEEFRTLFRNLKEPLEYLRRLDSPNADSEFEEDEDAILLTRKIAYQIVAPIIIATGIIGNALTIIILRSPNFKGVVFNLYYALALFDLLSLMLSISALMHMLFPASPTYWVAFWYSYFEVLFINVSMGTSVFIVVCITIDRYMSVCHPYRFKMLHTLRFCKIGIFISFAVAFAVWLPTCFLKEPKKASDCDTFYYVQEIMENSTLWVSCQYLDPSVDQWYEAYAWLREVIISFMPIAIVIVLNGFLVKYFIIKKNRPISSISSVSSQQRQAGDRNLEALLKAITITFLLTILPAGVFNAAFSEQITTNFEREVFRVCANNLELLNHALNFYLYILLSRQIRLELPFIIGKIKYKFVNTIKTPNISILNKTQNLKKSSESLNRQAQVELAVKQEISKAESSQTQSSDIDTEEIYKQGTQEIKIPPNHENNIKISSNTVNSLGYETYENKGLETDENIIGKMDFKQNYKL